MADQDPAALAREVLNYPALPEKVKLARAVIALTEERDALRALLAEMRREHDGHPEYGCGSLQFPKLPCDCGANEWNARIDAALRGKEKP